MTPTLHEYFNTDFKNVLKLSSITTLSNNATSINIETKTYLDFDAHTKYFAYFIPQITNSFDILIALIKNIEKTIEKDDQIEIETKLPGEKLISSKNLNFSGRIFIYHENEISEGEMNEIEQIAKDKDLMLQYRGPKFAKERSDIEKPFAFISHDSRDKETIAKPIAIGLSKLMCPVWFDEFSLKIGDNLRESIDRGIKESKKCILILSKYFLSNSGWTKTEFDSIFTKEMIEKENLILPIWVDVSKEDIYNYSSSLANKVGIQWSLGIKEVIRKIHQAIQNT